MSEQVRVTNNGSEARLQLTPADLGRLQITINTEGDNARVGLLLRQLLPETCGSIHAATEEMLQQSGTSSRTGMSVIRLNRSAEEKVGRGRSAYGS